MDHKKEIMDAIEAKASLFRNAADQIWGFAESRFSLERSASALCALLEGQGFRLTRGVAGMADAFVAEYGQGTPVIGILAEYDALENMSQKADLSHKEALCPEGRNPEGRSPEGCSPEGRGHGCQHNLLGAGAAAGAVGIKDYMEHHQLAGTLRLFGCPAEESGHGKVFMAREGVFRGVDAFLTWHPWDYTGLWDFSTLAVYAARFHFKGVSAHAAAAPELGRSALDAAELMNTGVNYLREHIPSDVRIHYAFTDAGGASPNVVQATASLYYYVRAPRREQAQAVFQRVEKVARGAAMMTETQVEAELDSICAEFVVNRTLGDCMYANLAAAAPRYTEAELAYAGQFPRNAPGIDKLRARWPALPSEELEALAAAPISTRPVPPAYPAAAGAISTDVGDASHIAPTAQVLAATAPSGTPPHSWQWVAAGKSPMAHRGMLAAAKAIALTAHDLLTNPTLLEKAWEEHRRNTGGRPYQSLLPDDHGPVDA